MVIGGIMAYDHKQALWSHMPYLSDTNVPQLAVSRAIPDAIKPHVVSQNLLFVDGCLTDSNLPIGIKVFGNKIVIENFTGSLAIKHINTVAVQAKIDLTISDSKVAITEHIFGGPAIQKMDFNWQIINNSQVMHSQHAFGAAGVLMINSNIEQKAATSYQAWRLCHSGNWLHEHTQIKLVGNQAVADIQGLLMAFEDNNCQMSATFEHIGLNTRGKHDVTMLVDANARGVCYSDVLVGSNASGTCTEQHNRNIALAATAEIFTQPRLCINNEQVECSHGATTGDLDQNMLRYMQSRGMSDAMAEQLLIKGYANAAVAGAPDESWSELAFKKLTDIWSIKC